VVKSSSAIPDTLKQLELSDLIRDLNVSEEAAEILTSRLKDKNCLGAGDSVTLSRNLREKKNYFRTFAYKKNLFTAKTSMCFG